MIRHRKHLNEVLIHHNLIGKGAEIGVAEGNFSREIASWSNITTLYMVDNWSTIEGQKGDGSFPQSWHDDNLRRAEEGMNEKCKILKGLSAEIAKIIFTNELVFLYIDADHSYEGVLSDLRMWSEKVVTGGIIAGHDFLNPSYGVRQAVEEFCNGKYQINIIPEFEPQDASFWFQKI
jgi:hypothetical protein